MSNFAIVFPGQGSQTVGMLAALSNQFDVVNQTFAEASYVLGYDLWALVQNGPDADLNQTHRTQPALLTASVAIWRVWKQEGGGQPSVMAGHSLGEYSALVCAGVIDFKQAVKLVELRGLWMQEAVPAGIGAMSVIIGLGKDAIAKACEAASLDQVVSPVSFNSPNQVVIAGNKEAVERANELCAAAGAKCALPLPISVPSHCALMKPAAEKLAKALGHIKFSPPSIPVFNNVDVSVETDPKAIKSALVRQMFNPVRWTECVEKMVNKGVKNLLEMGPSRVLTGFTKRIDRKLCATAVNDPASLVAEK
ncbi:ACP S-malonyltransferase [Candidatus Enterovibrio escicola]|uniref:Malonyl CoA-acyl carrier protein transacylase n=1 Tax=Candidatus Enterovibrio escicola TaxID=1927127 RepID=A0A2A5T2E8_9GAMM|nr:ACP S-malonyltransferase [Candidatus Enterovibrio escacola]PCS22326.1 Malonyl CoA-acyl carrier protein transacylase [Candidatus Enterovibrio escacola]